MNKKLKDKIDRITTDVKVDWRSAERGGKFSIAGIVTSSQLRAIADVAEKLSFEYEKKPESEKKKPFTASSRG